MVDFLFQGQIQEIYAVVTSIIDYYTFYYTLMFFFLKKLSTFKLSLTYY